ncbi:cell surface protein [Bifidobacterium bifidum]|uniref:Cell surface protein n=4 Tax=Bifidobacterium bifidum TaxID=1681 RepID=A0ABM7ETM0_BIFBI|nr:SpaA isopeptide-forming pilin-related protein [Bifidobacterium bifidum]ERI82687.1 LPXTG-motif protein cell wall anchor domain protein [Bifidobacterium bifidum ATCC 29521 = JCM 1255 = DSM 20456]KFI44017.1 Cell surface protein with gram positive anchor domain [Bifidobacterium bifidum]MBA4557047.1 cell surface protein [Bifidobacterium bifidum]MBI6591416.1 cell surface protein [Bifidobacterium bifidum]MBP0625889.1 cell surface protein [Bifidobacterium bifidum]
MVVLAMVLALSVGGTASGEDMPAGTSTAETAVKSAGKTGEITFPVGSYIVDMGNTSSDDAQLKPYGLIYDLVLNAKVPVYWVINGSKTSQTGVDLTYNGKGYISGPFVISGDDVDYNVRSMLSKWRGYGVSIDGPTDTAVTVDNSRKISSVPRVVLDNQNGKIAKGYLVKSGILRNENTTDDRVYKEKATPADLDSSCDDIYVMPHAEPTTATHSPLASFNKGGGYIWAGCHAVSYLESNTKGKGVDDGSMFFLSANGLLIGDKHKKASGVSGAYRVTGAASDPIMQFVGNTFAAHANGAEEIYMPAPGSAWRATTRVLETDPNQRQVLAGMSPGPAVFMAVGPGYGDYGNGMVMYEAGHEFKKNTDADRNAIRAFLNFLILSGVEKSLDVKATIPSDATAGSTVQASVTVTKGTPPYTYQWQSDCNASFSDPTGSATSITFPNEGPCHVKVTVKDQCGRATFDTRLVDVKTRKGTVSWRKTDTENNPLAGSSWTLTGPDGQSRTITDNGDGDEDRTDGSFRVTGLDMGAYTLTDSQAPSGFHKDDSSHPFTLDNTHPDWTFTSGFVNSPTPATVTVNGSKTLTGRDSKNGETFRFTFIPSDQATRQAVRDKTITVSKTRSVGGLRDGVAKAGTYTFYAAEDRTDCPGDLACSKAGYRITITATGGTASSGALTVHASIAKTKDDEGNTADVTGIAKAAFTITRVAQSALPLTGASEARNNTMLGLSVIAAALVLAVLGAKRSRA